MEYSGNQYLIKTFRDNTYICFEKGKFDKWCLWYYKNHKRIAVTDKIYFTWLSNLAKQYGRELVYRHFMNVFESVNHTDMPSENMLAYIESISEHYIGNENLAAKTFTMLYATMIAEEKKENARLGKFIKNLAVIMILKYNTEIDEVTVGFRNRKAAELWKMCIDYGIVPKDSKMPPKRTELGTYVKNVSDLYYFRPNLGTV